MWNLVYKEKEQTLERRGRYVGGGETDGDYEINRGQGKRSGGGTGERAEGQRDDDTQGFAEA